MNRFLNALIRLFPRGFRLQFGADLAAYVGDGYERARSAGWTRALGFTLATAIDLTRSAVAERLDPTWRAPSGATTNEGITGLIMAGFTSDFRFALRALLRSPGIAAVMIGTLGLAIGANAGIFSVVDAVLRTHHASIGDQVALATLQRRVGAHATYRAEIRTIADHHHLLWPLASALDRYPPVGLVGGDDKIRCPER